MEVGTLLMEGRGVLHIFVLPKADRIDTNLGNVSSELVREVLQ
jgi:hypothetical protein